MIIYNLHHLRGWTYGICQHFLTACTAGCTVDPIQTRLHSFGWLTLFFQGWLDIISARVLPFEWQLLMFQTSVNCRIQFRKHPVFELLGTLNIIGSLGNLFSLHKISYFIWFCRFQNVALLFQFTYVVIEFQCKMPFVLCTYRKLYLLKRLSSLTSLIVQIH